MQPKINYHYSIPFKEVLLSLILILFLSSCNLPYDYISPNPTPSVKIVNRTYYDKNITVYTNYTPKPYVISHGEFTIIFNSGDRVEIRCMYSTVFKETLYYGDEYKIEI